MPTIVDYSQVLATLTASGFRSLYHNSGSFGLVDQQLVKVIGWIGADDPTIRPAAREAIAQRVALPYEIHLTALLSRSLAAIKPGRIWIMPGSHWAYELDFGNASWLPEALSNTGIDSADLASRNNGAAIEFQLSESEVLESFVKVMLANLSGSDFKLAFPDRATNCTIHHHQQLWWETVDEDVARVLRESSSSTNENEVTR